MQIANVSSLYEGCMSARYWTSTIQGALPNRTARITAMEIGGVTLECPQFVCTCPSNSTRRLLGIDPNRILTLFIQALFMLPSETDQSALSSALANDPGVGASLLLLANSSPRILNLTALYDRPADGAIWVPLITWLGIPPTPKSDAMSAELIVVATIGGLFGLILIGLMAYCVLEQCRA